MFRAYPRTRELVRAVGIPSRDLRPVAGGAVFVDDGRAVRLRGLAAGDRARSRAVAGGPGAPGAARGVGARQVASRRCWPRTRTSRARRSCCGRPGCRGRRSSGCCGPLFGVITLDRTLSADPGYFRFLLSMLVRGPAVIPSDGLGMLAEWTSAAVRQDGGAVELARAGGGPGDRRRGPPGDRGCGWPTAGCSARGTWCWRWRGPRPGSCWSRWTRRSAARLPREYASVGERGLRAAPAAVQRPVDPAQRRARHAGGARGWTCCARRATSRAPGCPTGRTSCWPAA